MCAEEIKFLALSHAAPETKRDVAKGRDESNDPTNNPRRGLTPNNTPVTRGVVIVRKAGVNIYRYERERP